jgi:hypothetical protein
MPAPTLPRQIIKNTISLHLSGGIWQQSMDSAKDGAEGGFRRGTALAGGVEYLPNSPYL